MIVGRALEELADFRTCYMEASWDMAVVEGS